MDTTLAPAAVADPLAPRAASTLNRLSAMPLRGKVALGAAVGLLTLLLVVGFSLGRQPEWRVLYSSVSDRDGGAVLAALAQMNVPHKFSEGGGAILVPADRVHDVRLRLASQGLPKGGTVGFELMENQRFGVTQFQERLNFQRGLEGELARSIMALSAVQTARVHLALPNQTAFLREQQKPSASVLLTLYGGRTLDRSQIAGIVHLVAASVPDLQPRSVSVVDQSGTLLSQAPGEIANGLDGHQLQYVRQTEQSLAARILAIVEPIVGPDNVKAQVTADIDFTQSETTAELYTPNQGTSPAAVRSQQLSEAPTGPPPVGGSPGALANQPPVTPPSPPNGPPQAPTAGAAAAPAVPGVKRDATTNYEVDKTVRVVRNASGNIKRLSVAVIVNHANAKGADGATAAKPLTPEQMAQINALVREAIGFSKERGDSVNVVNAPFNVVAAPTEPAVPLWRHPDTVAMARSLAPWIALPLVALIIVMGLVRPAIRAARMTAPPPRLLDATVHDAISLPTPGMDAGLPAGVPLLQTPDAAQRLAAQQQVRSAQVDQIRQMVRENPATVANVVRNWVNQGS